MPHQVLADLQFFRLCACVEEIGAAFAAAGSDLAPILGDTVVSNVMLDDKGGVKLVDFDFAGRGDPARDIAGLCLEACTYDGDGIEAIVEMYVGAARPDILARVRLLMIAEDFVWAAWAACLHGTSPRKDDCDFFAYAGTRLLRAGHMLARNDVPSLTRAI
jgi:thiamine kinase-like enzyme